MVSAAMPTDLITHDDNRDQNRKVLMVIFAIIGVLIAISLITILLKN
jgi:hypothetical protein